MAMMGKSRPVRPRAFSLSWANRTSKPATSPARIECLDIFSPAPGDKDVISQIDRLSSKDTKIAGRSVWIAVDASVRSAATCMVVSRVGGLATSLCRARRSLSRHHGILHLLLLAGLPAHLCKNFRAFSHEPVSFA